MAMFVEGAFEREVARRWWVEEVRWEWRVWAVAVRVRILAVSKVGSCGSDAF